MTGNDDATATDEGEQDDGSDEQSVEEFLEQDSPETISDTGTRDPHWLILDEAQQIVDGCRSQRLAADLEHLGSDGEPIDLQSSDDSPEGLADIDEDGGRR